MPSEVRCWVRVHASEGGGAEQGRSRQRAITPVLDAQSTGGPHSRPSCYVRVLLAARHCPTTPMDPIPFCPPPRPS